ncbi:hypothetical protein P4H31_12070 [Paenibacillus odorifer]|nr:hypothetical protein [Paenibacillus odorifer]MEC0221948.1 hypothetical protein [Paenibacillus odorifer]
MGGFTVVPDYTLDSLPVQYEMLILIGGTGWKDNSAITPVIEKCLQESVPLPLYVTLQLFWLNMAI